MSRPGLIVALVIIGSLGWSWQTASSARADGFYFSESIGSAKLVGGSEGLAAKHGFQARIALGHAFQDWAIELGGGGSFYFGNNSELVDANFGVRLKRFFPLNPYWRLYLRGGVAEHFAELSNFNASKRGSYSTTELHGRGIDYGAGIQVSGRVRAIGFLFWPLFFTELGPKVSVSAFGEAAGSFAKLQSEVQPPIHLHSNGLILGIKVGGGF